MNYTNGRKQNDNSGDDGVRIDWDIHQVQTSLLELPETGTVLNAFAWPAALCSQKKNCEEVGL